jgi:hypothetical protein
MANLVSWVIKRTTVHVDLRRNEDELLSRMKRQKRQNIKAGLQAGITVREGTKDGLDVFFDYMLETCKRRGVPPNPPNKNAFDLVWSLFSPTGTIRLFFAEYGGERTTGMVVLPLGDYVTLWKFGWSGRFAEHRPNEVLYWEVIKVGQVERLFLCGFRRCGLVRRQALFLDKVCAR